MNSWDDMKSVVFVISEEWITSPLELKILLDQTFNDLKRREIILITNRKKKSVPVDEVKSITPYSHFDFNLFGSLKNEKIKEIMLNSFDTLIICGTLSKKMSKVLLKSKFQRIIGLNSENDFIEINLHTKSNEPSEMVNFAKNTLSKIIS